MNASFDPLHLVNTYGAFGSITRERMEVILEGTEDVIVTASTQWREYEFKAKPGDVRRRPRWVSPYHYKLDWQMWFAAMASPMDHPWIFNLVAKLLQGDRRILGLLRNNPFPAHPPRHIRASLYRYRFTDARETTGFWWKRQWAAEYLPALSLESEAYQSLLRELRSASRPRRTASTST